MENTKKTVTFANFIALWVSYFVSAGFMYWAWTILAPHLNAPLFTYWEVFALRMGFTYFTKILWQK